jgi:hypothetical protein
MVQVRQVNAVRYETSSADPERKRIHGGHAITIGKRDDELALSSRVGIERMPVMRLSVGLYQWMGGNHQELNCV